VLGSSSNTHVRTGQHSDTCEDVKTNDCQVTEDAGVDKRVLESCQEVGFPEVSNIDIVPLNSTVSCWQYKGAAQAIEARNGSAQMRVSHAHAVLLVVTTGSKSRGTNAVHVCCRKDKR
jgi:hypothetical protein